MNAALRKLVIALIIALVAGAIAYQQFNKQKLEQSTVPVRKVLYWYDPMQPNQHFDKPGKSPFMDMQLIAKYADEIASAGIQIDAATQQRLAVRTALVERAPMAISTSVVGTIIFDERDLIVLQARASGFVQRVYVHTLGDSVRRNDPLVDILVPEWAGVQREIIALKNSGDAQLLAAVRARALALGLSVDQIAAIEKSENASPVFTVRAPQAGVVKTLDVREGMNIDAGSALLALNGIERVWFEMAVPENEAAMLRPEETISIQLNLPATKIIGGKIIALLPELNDATRTVRVRAELDNKNGELRIGQYAQAKIVASNDEAGLSIPTEALIRGADSDRVVVLRDDGSFAAQAIEAGREIGDRVEVRAGLHEGQRIVTSGQFLIDSEANLRGEFQRMQSTGAHDQGAHQHD